MVLPRTIGKKACARLNKIKPGMEHDQEADVFALELNDGPNKKVLLSSCRDDE